LYNSYDPRRFHDIMRRNLARVAPLCAAFDCNLAVFGFPFDEGRRRESKNPDAPDLRQPADVADFIVDSTSIGEDGDYLRQLADGGRFTICDFPGKGFPPQLGRPIMTTPHPESGKNESTLDVAKELAAGRSQMLLIGLGPRGLPAKLLKDSKHHLELTGKGISMETATAMGALPAMVHAHLQHLTP
jgi:hypothetical protein